VLVRTEQAKVHLVGCLGPLLVQYLSILKASYPRVLFLELSPDDEVPVEYRPGELGLSLVGSICQNMICFPAPSQGAPQAPIFGF
jgi:hypothetical protein